jgi:flagellar hook-length control protein FliK
MCGDPQHLTITRSETTDASAASTPAAASSPAAAPTSVVPELSTLSSNATSGTGVSSPTNIKPAAHTPIKDPTSKTATSRVQPAIPETANASEGPEAAQPNSARSGVSGIVGAVEDSESHPKASSTGVRSDNSTATDIFDRNSLHRSQTSQHVSGAQRNSPDAAGKSSAPKIVAGAPPALQPANYDAAAAKAVSPVATAGLVQSRESTGSTGVEATAPILEPHQPVITGASTHTVNLEIELDAGDSVRASVRERAGVVDVRVVAGDQETVRHLTEQIPELRRTLDTAGMKLQSAQVSYQSSDQKQRSDPEPNESQEQQSADDNSQVFTLEETNR